MDKGIKLQKERAMGMKGADKEASSNLPKNVKAFKCGGSVKKSKGGKK